MTVCPSGGGKSTLWRVSYRVLGVSIEMEVIIVDDKSTDGTREYLSSVKDERIRTLYHSTNRGKGAAIRTALGQTTGDVVIIQDADLEYDPREFRRLIEPISTGMADVVYGSRFVENGRGTAGLMHYVANKLLTHLSNLTTGLKLTDMETCYKAFQGEIARSLVLESSRFDIEPEITAKVARMGARIREVPIGYRGRATKDGKKIGLRDAFEAVGAIIRHGRGVKAQRKAVLGTPATNQECPHQAE